MDLSDKAVRSEVKRIRNSYQAESHEEEESMGNFDGG
jgi:hypothetical protein